MKKFIYIVGLVVVAVLTWRFVRNMLNPPRLGPRQNLTVSQKKMDDNAPASIYAMIVPPIAQNVTPQAGNIILRRNDSVIPDLYTLGAIGPNTNS